MESIYPHSQTPTSSPDQVSVADLPPEGTSGNQTQYPGLAGLALSLPPGPAPSYVHCPMNGTAIYLAPQVPNAITSNSSLSFISHSLPTTDAMKPFSFCIQNYLASVLSTLPYAHHLTPGLRQLAST